MNVWSTLDCVAKPSRRMPWPELEVPFAITVPQKALPVLFASPHSGRCYPKEFTRLSTLNAHALRVSEDAWVDALFSGATHCGASLLSARFPRAMVDVNRGPGELDPAMYEDHCPVPAHQKSMRIRAGFGVIPRVVAADMEIYAGKIPYATAVQRLHHLHKPYHDALLSLLQHQKHTLGSAILIDCHSMPSNCAAHCPGGVADFVLGDGHGQTCRPALIAHIEHTLIAMGYTVVRNTPYSGGYATVRYGQQEKGFESVQIEINRSLYMNEKTLKKSADFIPLRQNMRRLCKAICGYAQHNMPLP